MLDSVFVPLDSTLLSLLVVALAVLAAINLFLSLRLTTLVGALAHARLPDTVPIGVVLPDFRARTLDDGRRVDSDTLLAEQATVLVFLSPGCKSCLERLPELRRMQPLMEEAGVALWVIVNGRERRLRAYFESTGLLSRVLRVSDSDMRKLNPKYSAPFYIFVDATRIVQASDLIGDENWLNFRDQIGDAEFIDADATGTNLSAT
jgi:hemin uptake protein HemP